MNLAHGVKACSESEIFPYAFMHSVLMVKRFVCADGSGESESIAEMMFLEQLPESYAPHKHTKIIKYNGRMDDSVHFVSKAVKF